MIKATTHVCNRCHVEKPLDQFQKNLRMISGHLNTCKECKNAYERSRQDQRADYMRFKRDNDPDYVQRNRDATRERMQKLRDGP